MDTRTLTVCFADIDRFLVATRNMALPELATFLQGFYERVGEVLLAHNGDLVKYVADAAMVTFDQGREEIAVRAMLALRRSYREYITTLPREAQNTDLNVGIATGRVLVGEVGHPRMLSYDVVGAPVGLAATLTFSRGVLLDRATYEAVAGRFTVEEDTVAGHIHAFRIIERA